MVGIGVPRPLLAFADDLMILVSRHGDFDRLV
jgi:hypothetical protein